MLEKEIEKRMREAIKKAGGRAYKFLSPGCVGVPDRIVIMPGGKIYFVELKRSGESLRPIQKQQVRRLRDLGCQVRTVAGLEEMAAFLAEVGA